MKYLNKSYINNFVLHPILNFILPTKCVLCKEIVLFQNTLCLNCWPKIIPFHNYDSNYSGIVYDKISSELFLRFKYNDECHLANFFAKWMINAAPNYFFDSDIITAVPLHWRRLAFRMYNQSVLLAAAIIKTSKKPVLIPNLLKRVRHTPVQNKNRKENVKDAFSTTKDVINKKILLIDDVYTTGATVNECKKTLLKSGASKVHILTAGRVLKHVF
jgi:competence protein ComFC